MIERTAHEFRTVLDDPGFRVIGVAKDGDERSDEGQPFPGCPVVDFGHLIAALECRVTTHVHEHPVIEQPEAEREVNRHAVTRCGHVLRQFGLGMVATNCGENSRQLELERTAFDTVS